MRKWSSNNDLMIKDERFVSRYIANAIYCIIWKYRDIAIFRKYRDILTIFSVHDIGQFWPFMDLHGQFLLLNLVVYWHVSFNWLVSAFTFLSSCDESRPFNTELLIPQQETGGLSSRLKVWFDQKSEQERTVVEYHHISFCSAHKCTNKQLFHRVCNVILCKSH